MRKAAIYYKDVLVGILTETDEGEYTFQYEEKYIREYPKQFVTFSMPVNTKTYTDKQLLPFQYNFPVKQDLIILFQYSFYFITRNI